MSGNLIGFQAYAPGALKTRAQVLDLVVEARKSKRAIRLYAVEQSGYQSEVYLTSKSQIITNSYGSDELNVWAKSRSGQKRYYGYVRCLGDLNISDKSGRHSGHNRHQLFTNRMSADAYAKALREDAPYQRAVKDWHARCSKIFGELGW